MRDSRGEQSTGPSRVAVVTGGASGIGLGVVLHLLSLDMAVVAVDIDAAACARLSAETHDRLRVVAADVGGEDDARAAIDAASREFGRVDLLCNNAGVHPIATIEELDLADWRETFRVNVDAALLCSKAALPEMRRGGGGAIVNIASISGLVPYAGGAAYASSKAALIMLTKVLALEAGPLGVRVNCICPGAIDVTGGTAETPAALHIPVGRRGTPDDVAHMVAYLASDEAGYVNGAVFVLDGGATAGRVRSQR